MISISILFFSEGTPMEHTLKKVHPCYWELMMQHARFPEFSSSECTSPATLILRRRRTSGSSTKYKNRCNVNANVYWYNSAKHQIPTSFSSLNFSEIHTYALTSPIATYEFLYWLCFRRIYPKVAPVINWRRQLVTKSNLPSLHWKSSNWNVPRHHSSN